MPEKARVEYRGIVSIRWSHPASVHSRGDGWVRPLAGYVTAICDEVTGKPITTVSHSVIHAPIDGLITASLTMFATAEGEAIFSGEPVFGEDGEVVTGVFEFMVHRLETA